MTPEEAKDWFNRTTELTKFKKYQPVVKYIVETTNFLSSTSSMPQRLWHIINQTQYIPGCKTCGTPVSWDRRYKRYKVYCGNPQCPNMDEEIIQQKRLKTNYAQAVSKRAKTNLQKYGHTNYLASTEGKIKIKYNKRTPEENLQRKIKREQTLLKKYGVLNISQTKISPEIYQCLQSKEWLYEQHYQLQKSLTQIADELNVAGGPTTIGRYLRLVGLETQTLPARSYGEKQIEEWLNNNNIKTLIGDRNLINPWEIDIFLPEFNVAIEYCGLYWHSEQQGKDRLYHATKYHLCHQKNIKLLTIFEDEWFNRQEQVKRKILSILGKSEEKIVYARKCNVVKINDLETKQNFFEKNHIQGNGQSTLCYGLVYENNIVAMMAWKKQPNDVWLLNRYATSCRVVGGFSKLVEFFKKENLWSKLISFADLRWSDGNLYSKNGWIAEATIQPDYYYSPDGHTRIHKFNYRRKNLDKLLPSFDPSLSESENCKNNNILRIWDCGKIRFSQHRT